MTLCYVSMQYRDKFRICMNIIDTITDCPIYQKDPNCNKCVFYIPIPIQDRLFNEWAYAGATWGDPYETN